MGDEILNINSNDKMDELEAAMINNFKAVDCPLTHRFVPGMYIREIFMPKGSLITSMIHKTNHPFFVLKGKVSVYSDNDGEQLIEAPFIGITTPNTRRVLYIHEDCVWATCHATEIKPSDDSDEAVSEAVGKITDEIIERHINPLLGVVVKNNALIEEKELLIQ